MIISGKEVAKYLSDFIKINPNGIDLAPLRVFKIPDNSVAFLHKNMRGYIKEDETFIEIYDNRVEIHPDSDGYYKIQKGSIIEIVLPKVSVPKDMIALIFPRSTFNRLGIIKSQTGVLDAGFSGTPTQTFYFPISAKIHKSEAWVQMVFLRIENPTDETYSGYYQEKDLSR